ncbi:MAG: sigma-54-dependent transcriptional regulator [Candidatus Hodarchaeota archaeon]
MKPGILVTEGDERLREDVRILLCDLGFEVIEAADKASAFRFFQSKKPDLIIIGSCRRSARDELKVVEQIRDRDANIPLILVTRHSSEARIIASFRAGINDYFKTPLVGEELAKSIRGKLLDTPRQSSARDRKTVPDFDLPQTMIGESPQMREIKAYLTKVAATDSTLLIAGETGTGKELAAEFVHLRSRRHKRSFVCVNCAALPENLIESEMFGYERGAFTGAVTSQLGKFALARGGTLFLDEIGDLSIHGQAKILGVLERKRVYPLGGRKPIPLDVRIIAATNQNLEGLVADRKFREDLYFRLNVARVDLPPLRERKEEIPGLLEHYIDEFNLQFGENIRGFTGEAITAILQYDWPGNIRELKNLLEATFINRPSGEITFLDLPKDFQLRIKGKEKGQENEREQILSALLATKWNKTKAAQKLNWSRMTLYRKMAKYHISSSPSA